MKNNVLILIKENIRKVLFSLFKIYHKIYLRLGFKRISFLKKLVLFFDNKAFPLLRPEYVYVHENKIFLDEKDILKLSIWGVYEPFETDLIMKEVKKNDIVIDAGAHIGYYTLILAKLVGENGRVFAFEPDLKNFNLLKKNVESNGYKNVVLVQKALSNKSEKIKLYISKETTDHRIYDPKDGRESVEIETVILDEYLNDFQEDINLIKMDIQGSEFVALEGMKEIIQRSQNLKMFTEFWPKALRENNSDPIEYLKCLFALKFSLFRIVENKESLEKVDSANSLETLPSSNLFCIKS